MGTKLNPGRYDCYAALKDDEPHFVLMARDPHFARVIGFWAMLRMQSMAEGKDPLADVDKVQEALQCAREGEAWRSAYIGFSDAIASLQLARGFRPGGAAAVAPADHTAPSFCVNPQRRCSFACVDECHWADK